MFAIATALCLLGTGAQAATYHVHGVTVSFRDGCRAASCVTVDAPAYGVHHGARDQAGKDLAVRNQPLHKDQARILPEPKPDSAPPATTAPAAAPNAVAPTTTQQPAPMKTAEVQ
jgi:hypothetical protein